ncbi:MAG: hypothetical protein ACFFCY_01235 [Promethearchaeota archaeon]
MTGFKVYLKSIKDGLAGIVDTLYLKGKVPQKQKPRDELLENAKKHRLLNF